MTQYLLSVYQPDGPIPAPEVLAGIGRNLDALHQEIKAAGAWVFAGGLQSPAMATVLRLHDDDVVETDGPFAEGKEHLGGFVDDQHRINLYLGTFGRSVWTAQFGTANA